MKFNSPIAVIAALLAVFLLVFGCIQQPSSVPPEDDQTSTGPLQDDTIVTPGPEDLPEEPLGTSVEFEKKVVRFSSPGAVRHNIGYWYSKVIGFSDDRLAGDTFFFDGRLYTYTLDEQAKILLIKGDDVPDQELKAYDVRTAFVPNELSTKTIELEGATGNRVKYHYKVAQVYDDTLKKNVHKVYLLLASQTFALQAGKKMSFEGMDRLENGKVQEKYYMLDTELDGFGYDSLDGQDLIAHFYIDEENDGFYDLKVFIESVSDLIIDLSVPGLGGYNCQIEFKENNESKCVNFESGGSVTTAKGTKIAVSEFNSGTITMKK